VLRYFRCYSAENAEDLVGEVFLQIVRDLPGFTGGEDQFRAWVFTIARRRLVDEWRRQGRRREEPRSDLLAPTSAEADEVEQHALARLGEQRVRSVLARLTPAQRDVLFLRIIAGLSIAETAQVLGNTPGGVKSLQIRGLEAIVRVSPEEAVS
jgi:RNA polymerase sigma-70 factor (ECF subfamily)